VLIVDDDARFRATARLLLEADGYRVIGEAADGAAAVEASNDLRPDIVLLDVRLPVFDGFEVLRRISAESHRPVVILTSSRDASDYGQRIGASGAAGFVPKAEVSGPAIGALAGRD